MNFQIKKSFAPSLLTSFLNMKLKYLLLFFFFVIGSTTLLAQSLADIGKVKVDMLSDAQLQEMLQRAKDNGLNESQVVTMARERGMPAGEVGKLQQRLAKLKQGGQKETKMGADSDTRTMEGEDQLSPERAVPELETLSPYQQKIFGFSLFYNKKLNFNPSLSIPTPQGYVLGSGDQLLIDVYGASQQSFDLKVSPEGKILIPNVGAIAVGGSTVGAATARIKTSLTQIYSGLQSGISFLEVRLGNIRTVSVALVGELNQPGNYTLPAFASPFNALFAAGGPNENGSFRHIQVYRDNKLLTEIDVYDFLIKGEHTTSITLRDNDVIIVPPVRTRVELTGPVRREGYFEVKPNENLTNLLSFAGDFKPEAYQDRVTLSRMTGSQMRVEEVTASNFGTFVPKDGDTYRIGEILDRYENRVQISGALNRPGTFELTEGMTVGQLIQRAQGLRPDAFVTRATLYRTEADYSLAIVPVDVQGILSGKVADFPLQREDVLVLPSRYDLQEEYYLKISGEVNNPGAFAYGADMRVGDLILQAGGFTAGAETSRIEIVRRKNSADGSEIAEIIPVTVPSDLSLQDNAVTLLPFDHVMVRRNPGFRVEQLVRVEGEVLYPGEYAVTSANDRISDLLLRAGGFTRFAYPKGATLIRRNEYFQPPTEAQQQQQVLESVKKNLPLDSLSRSELNKELEGRINKEIADKAKATAANPDVLQVDLYKKQTLQTLSERDSLGVQVEIKTTEMIGIDLEAIFKNPKGKEDLILLEGDVLSIPKELQTVRMRGELLFPTSTRFQQGAGFRQYISKAGGFTDRSRKGRAYVVYANGDVSRTHKLLFFSIYPRVAPGAEIIVPQKPERQGMTAQGWIGIGTSLATLGLLINQLIPAN
jgi:protein involved in polysaccharide export with SLBB domain